MNIMYDNVNEIEFSFIESVDMALRSEVLQLSSNTRIIKW